MQRSDPFFWNPLPDSVIYYELASMGGRPRIDQHVDWQGDALEITPDSSGNYARSLRSTRASAHYELDKRRESCDHVFRQLRVPNDRRCLEVLPCRYPIKNDHVSSFSDAVPDASTRPLRERPGSAFIVARYGVPNVGFVPGSEPYTEVFA